jgi:hypothetical protein
MYPTSSFWEDLHLARTQKVMLRITTRMTRQIMIKRFMREGFRRFGSVQLRGIPDPSMPDAIYSAEAAMKRSWCDCGDITLVLLF